MSTRNLIAVMLDGEYKVAQYGEFDGFPSGQGLMVLRFLRETDLDEFKEKLTHVRFLNDKEWKDIYKKHTNHRSIFYKNVGAKILYMIRDDSITKLRNSIAFAGDSLFCEYAYVIDFDRNTFEVYEGFNTEPITEGRFTSDDPTLKHDDVYEPVKLIKVYDINNLPSDELFLFDLNSGRPSS